MSLTEDSLGYSLYGIMSLTEDFPGYSLYGIMLLTLPKYILGYSLYGIMSQTVNEVLVFCYKSTVPKGALV